MSLEDYEPVAARLDRWLNQCGAREVTGRVITELLHRTDDVAVFKCELWEDDTLIAVGHAEDYRSGRGPTSTNWFEVAETSAVGRALANAGLAGSNPDRRPSREEMQKAVAGSRRPQEPRNEPIRTVAPQNSGRRSQPTEKMAGFYRKLCQERGCDVDPAALEDFDVCRSEIDRLKAGSPA